jgi:large repetitive protein
MAIRRYAVARAALVALASFGAVGGLFAVLVRQPGNSTTDVRATPGTTWLSGEAQGQIVLAAAGGELASIGISLGNSADELDVIDVGQSVFVHNRTAGEIIRLAGVDGELKDRYPAPKAAAGPTDLIRAGNSVYLIDQTKSTAQRINDDGTRLDPQTLPSFSSWVGTDDGRIWLVDTKTGNVTAFDGQQPRTSRVIQLGADSELTAVGGDPILVDRTNGRLRWLRRGVTFEADVNLANAIVQQPSLRGTCLQMLAEGALRCYSPKRLERELPLKATPAAGDQLFVNERNALVVGPSKAAVLLGSWRTRSWSQADRPSPSSRTPVAWANPGPLLVDDPGSRFAMTADDARLVVLDKFSRLTVLSESGDDPNAIGIAVAGAGPNDPDQTQVLASQIVRDAAKNKGGPNQPPMPQPDRVITRSGRSVQIAVLANDDDPNGDILAVSSAGPIPENQGKVIVSDGQILNYSPPDRFVGQVVFPYTVIDPGNLKASSTVTVDVIGNDRNSAPRLNDDSARTLLNTGITIDVLANDHDDEGDPLTITGTSTPAHGTASLRPEGIRFEPAAGYLGPDEFTYTVIDGFGGTSTAAVRVTVLGPEKGNRPPVAVDDRGTTRAGKHVILPVLVNDVDPDGDRIHIIEVRETAGLTFSIVGGQAVDVLPANNLSGPVSFTYTIEDSGGLRASAAVILLVDAISENRPPQAVDDRVTSSSIAVNIEVLANDSDPDGDPLTITSFTQPASGRASRVSPSALRYEPNAGSTGTQTFSYTIADPSGQPATAKVIVEVIQPTKSGPIARDDFATMFAGDTLTLYPLRNDSHPDGLSFALSGTPVGRGAAIQTNADGSMSFTPPDATPATYTFSYTIQDVNGKTATAQIAITVQAKPVVNRAPIARDDRADVAFGTGVTIAAIGNDSDPDNDPIHIVEVGTTTAGTTSFSAAGIIFTPAAQFSGLASFGYTISDVAGLRASARVVVQVADRPKAAPIATADSVVSVGGVRVSLDPLLNDSDPDGAAAALSIQSVASLSNGLTVTSNGRLVTIDPPKTPGTYEARYVIVDADGLTATATITVTVQSPPNQPPVASPDRARTPFGVPVTIDVLANDTDPDGGKLTITAVSTVTPSGALAILPTGVRFTPVTGFAGPATFTYTVSDPQGGSSTASVSVIVDACVAPAPLLSDDSASTRLNTPVTIDLYANDSSTVGTFALLAATPGSVVVVSPGVATYTPPPGFSGTARFAYSVTNPCGGVATATVLVTINRPPTANDDAATVTANQAVNIPVLANDSDPDGDPLTLLPVIDAVNGTATIQVTPHQLPSILFTPTPGYSGPARFSYTIHDPGGLTATATVRITVIAANRPPKATDDSAATAAGASVTFDVLSNDVDPDRDPLIITGISPPLGAGGISAGTATFNGRLVTFNPAPGFSGSASFTYTISDGNGGSDVGNVMVTVAAPPPVNRAPIAVKDAYTVPVGTLKPVTLTVLDNDSDPDKGDKISITAVSITSAPVGTTVTISNSGGSLILTLTDATFAGPISLTYTISDGSLSASTTVGVTIA